MGGEWGVEAKARFPGTTDSSEGQRTDWSQSMHDRFPEDRLIKMELCPGTSRPADLLPDFASLVQSPCLVPVNGPPRLPVHLQWVFGDLSGGPGYNGGPDHS